MTTFDFNRSYLRFRIDLDVQAPITVTHESPSAVNNVRINLECRCELANRRTGHKAAYVLGASCKTEIVGVARDVWMEPNADFCLVASHEEFLVIKSWARNNMPVAKHAKLIGTPRERQSGRAGDAWTQNGFQLLPAPGRSLRSIDEIIAAIRGDRPIVARTKYDDGDWQVTIEHPVKTINYSERDNVYQTDTGPVLLPDLSPERLARGERQVECFDLAFAAFNSVGWAEFIVNVPTPIAEGISVNHYSRPRRIEPVENSLVEVLVEPTQWHVGSDRAIRVDGAEPLAAASSAGNGASGVAVQKK